MKKIIYTALSLAPVAAFAQQTQPLTNIVNFISATVAALIPIMVGLALVFFFWGLIKYIRSAGDPKAAAEGKSIMIYGIIAIAVMLSVYGLVFWLQNVLGVTSNAPIAPPVVPGL